MTRPLEILTRNEDMARLANLRSGDLYQGDDNRGAHMLGIVLLLFVLVAFFIAGAVAAWVM